MLPSLNYTGGIHKCPTVSVNVFSPCEHGAHAVAKLTKKQGPRRKWDGDATVFPKSLWLPTISGEAGAFMNIPSLKWDWHHSQTFPVCVNTPGLNECAQSYFRLGTFANTPNLTWGQSHLFTDWGHSQRLQALVVPYFRRNTCAWLIHCHYSLICNFHVCGWAGGGKGNTVL